MNNKQKIVSIFLSILLSVFVLIPSFQKNISAKEYPNKLYKVYLDGKEIGIISSKEKLNNYINEDQTELKEKLGVEQVYLPKYLNIEEYIGFNSNLKDEKELYEEIKEKRPFTIKGSIITIKKPLEDGLFDTKVVNVLREEDYTKALESTIKTFISENEYNVFFDGNTYTNFEMGSTIEDIFIEEEALGNVTIKRNAYIPSDEMIFTDEKTLAHYLLFGTLEEQGKYKVKKGETIEQIAFNNKLGPREFLIINPEFTGSTNLLYEGQEVNIGQLSSLLNVIKLEEKIEDVVTRYTTETVYDSTKPYGHFEVRVEGSNGLERLTKRIKYKNGVVYDAEIVETEVITSSINRVEVRGAKIADGPIIVADAGNWAWPTLSAHAITTYYEWRWGSFHAAIDIITFPALGSPIYAANSGNVVEVSGGGYNGGRGAYVIIDHNNGYKTEYLHLSQVDVNKGQAIEKGQIIGKMGNTGRSTGPHLHFAVIYDGKPINPLLLYR
jgi:murein DD-endopeptidase MepM/ murein hydrolase activator NlpD